MALRSTRSEILALMAPSMRVECVAANPSRVPGTLRARLLWRTARRKPQEKWGVKYGSDGVGHAIDTPHIEIRL
jgi:hypothetical protein